MKRLDDVLRQVAEFAKRTISAAVEVSVALVRGGHAQTAAFTGGLAEFGRVAVRRGTRARLDVSASGGVLYVPDRAVEERWPQWAKQAEATGVGSPLSIGLPIQQAVVYRHERHPWLAVREVVERQRHDRCGADAGFERD